MNDVRDSEMGEGDIVNCVGLVDRDAANEQIRKWRTEIDAQRGQPEAGAWLYIPRAEYLFD